MTIIRIGLDTAKHVFQRHGVDAEEQAVLRRRLGRQAAEPFFAKLRPTRIGLEGCGAAHYWARVLRALGHKVALLPPQYIKPYLKRGKNDALDPEAICEAMSRGPSADGLDPWASMRFGVGRTLPPAAAGLSRPSPNRLAFARTAARWRSVEPTIGTPRGLQWCADTAVMFGSRSAQPIRASGQCRPHTQAGHMTAIDQNRGPSTHGSRLSPRIKSVGEGPRECRFFVKGMGIG
jgi:hypothetical protein